MSAKAEIEGSEELQAKLDDPRMLGVPLQEFLEEASAIGRKAAVDQIDGGLGVAVRSISREVEPLSARVFTAMPLARALSIEEGRSPGTPENQLAWLDFSKRPPVWQGPLARWARAKGHDVTSGSSPVGAIIRAVSHQGVIGKRFMATARETIQAAFPGLLEQLARRVEELAKR